MASSRQRLGDLEDTILGPDPGPNLLDGIRTDAFRPSSPPRSLPPRRGLTSFRTHAIALGCNSRLAGLGPERPPADILRVSTAYWLPRSAPPPQPDMQTHRVTACVAAALVSLCALPSVVHGCWWWLDSTPATPLPKGVFKVNDPQGDGSLGHCKCKSAQATAGGLYKTDQGYLCEYTDLNTYGLSYCGPGEYSVLVQTFTTDGPWYANSSASTPCLADSVPLPGKNSSSCLGGDVFLCAGRVRNFAPDGKLIAGALSFDPNGDRSCLVSESFGIGGLSAYVKLGDYLILHGNKCLLPPTQT